MSIGFRPARLTLVLGLVLVPLVAARGGEAENWERLRSMPRERRTALSDKIKEYDALAANEKAAIQTIDQKIADLSATDQANYRAVIHRYHLWLQSLTEDQRALLKSTPPAERMAAVTKLRAELGNSSSRRATPKFLQVADLDSPSPYVLAPRLKFWFALAPEERARLKKLEQFDELAQARGVKFNPSHHLTKAEEDALITKLESTHKLKNGLLLPHAKLEGKDAQKQAKVRKRLAENYYFIEHPPEAVDPENLLRFETALPPWFRSTFDPLPPEEARRRVTILYRLVFPHPAEMPVAKGPAAPPVAATPKAKAKAKPDLSKDASPPSF